MFKGFKLLKHLPNMADKQLQLYGFALDSNMALVRKVDIEAGIKTQKAYAFAS